MKIIQKLLALTILLGSLAVGWFWFEYQAFLQTPLSLPEDGLVYTLEPGGSSADVGRELAEKGALASTRYLRLLARQDANAGRLKAGEYLIPAGTTPEGLFELLAGGRSIQYAFTIIEGWSFKQMLQAVAADPRIKQTLEGVTGEQLMARLGRASEHPEGRFLPDTYHFPKGMSDVEVLMRAMQAMDKALEVEWAGRSDKLPLKTPYEALILASIVEKETGLAAERQQVAGVFTRRLNKGMLLQTDPTVIYGMGDAFDGNIRRKDLRRDTPYNTYTRKGLPPTPIAMPGRAAIHAALHPADGKSLYFVASGDGGHVFSNTLKEHNKAVRRYQLKRKGG